MGFVIEILTFLFFRTQIFLWSPALLIFHIIYKYWTSPLSKIPSVHWSAHWSRCFILWQIYHDTRRHAHYVGHTQKATKILPVIRVGPNEISIMSVDGIETVYDNGFDRSSHYSAFYNFGSPNMFSFPSRRDHFNRKRIVAPAYSKSSISGARLQSIFQTRLQKLVSFLESQADGQPLIVRNLFRALGADIFTAFTFSETEGTHFLDRLRTGPNTMKQLDMDCLKLWQEDYRNSFFFFESQPEFKYFSHFFAPHGRPIHDRFEAWITEIIIRYEAQIKDRLQDKGFSEHGIYWRLLAWKNSATAEKLSWRERASEVMDHMGAGHDSVPMALECIMEKLTLHPTCQARLRAELREKLPVKSFERSFAKIDKLPYLNATVMEALRVVTTLENYQPRVVPAGGCTIDDYYLPGGTIVSSLPYLMNNHPEIFPSPENFNPDRWLLSPEEYRTLSKRLFTFSSGPRACLGKELVIAMIKTTTAEILMHFETTLIPDSEKTWREGDEAQKPEFYFWKAL